MPAKAVAHPGGPQQGNALCSTCHTPDTGGVKSVAEAHKVPPPPFQEVVRLALTAPTNGKFYVAGDKPQVTIPITDAKTGTAINPATIMEPKDPQKVAANEWRRANLFVSGPRYHTGSALTTAAANPNPAEFYPENDFRVRVDP